MSPSDLNEDTEAQRGLDERQMDDTTEKGLWDNSKAQGSGMFT
jgi:hypothetical protein